MATLLNPYAGLQDGVWMKGNLHAHTTRTDGKLSMQEVLSAYAAHGYGFMLISDHDMFTGAAEYAEFDAEGLILIPGNEITAAGPHMLHVGCGQKIDPDPDRQKAIDGARADAGFVIVNHPNWLPDFDHCPLDSMRTWKGYAGIEIYNGVIGRLKGSPYATNKWDMMLSEGRRLWGFSNDDSHAAEDIALGWNMAWVTERTAEGVVDALAAGGFYASSGVTITEVDVDGRHIRIATQDAGRIVGIMQQGKRFAEADDCTIEVDVPEDARFVRFECWGTGEQFAWTQPFFAGEGA